MKTLKSVLKSFKNKKCFCLVYSIANFYMEYPLFYKVLKCDYQLNSLKIQDIQEFVCQHYQTKCPFHTIFNCRRISRLVRHLN